MSRFEIQTTPISDLRVIQRHMIGDKRGLLSRIYCREELESIIGTRQIVQINHTLTQAKGTVRGMHFQYPPHAEMKLVTCLRGEIFDVAVDLRRESSSFLQWHAEILSDGNQKTLAIPEGFAHGFQALSEGCELLYLHTAAYAPSAEGGLDALDPALSIDWPLPISERSKRDEAHPHVGPDFAGIAT
jgi:dTDP-4-dehydrorhamnose 3,5-epimerase